MRNHKENKHNSRMMLVMMLFCAAPLLLIVVFGAGGKALGASSWVIFGGIAVMVAIHFLLMSRGRKHSDEGQAIIRDNKTHSGHGCCH